MERTATAPLWVRSSEVVVVVSRAALAWGGSNSISVDAILSGRERGPLVMRTNPEQLQKKYLNAGFVPGVMQDFDLEARYILAF